MAKIRPLTFSLCLAGVLALPIAAQADDYRSELTGFFERALFDGDVSPDDADLFGAQYQWYFKPVKTDGLPLAEAAFLNRSSFVAAAITFAEFGDEDFDTVDPQPLVADPDPVANFPNAANFPPKASSAPKPTPTSPQPAANELSFRAAAPGGTFTGTTTSTKTSSVNLLP